MDWWYAENGGQKGPVGEEELAKLLKRGDLPPDTLVWNETLTEWTPASRCFTFRSNQAERPRRPGMVTAVLIVAGILVSAGLIRLWWAYWGPAPIRSFESVPWRRTVKPLNACQNNLKQLGIVMKMFANENGGQFPPLDPRPGYLMFPAEEISPVYLIDTKVMVCPVGQAHGESAKISVIGGQSATASNARVLIEGSSYWYLGYATSSGEEGLAFVEAYKALLKTGTITPERGSTIVAPDGTDVQPLREGVERFHITDINNPAAAATAQSTIPVIVERPGNHGGGANVLYMDGHVEFLPYPGKYPMTERFIEALRSVDDLRPVSGGYRGSIAGHIVTANQQRVAGVPVELIHLAGAPLDRKEIADLVPLRECSKQETVTDAQGAFRFDDLPAGHYGIKAATETDLATDDMPMRVMTEKDGPGSFVAASAKRRMGMSPELQPAESLTGRVIAPDGQPAAGAEVYPYSQGAGAAPLSVAESYMLGQKCGEDGSFHFPKLKKGLWQFAVSVNGGQPVLKEWFATGDRNAEIRLGEDAPGATSDIVARTLNGDVFRLSALRGKYVLLNFWATWCGPCVAEMPNVKAVYEEYRGDPRLVMVGMDLDPREEDAQRYVSENGLGWTQVVLGDWSRTPVPGQYGVQGIPCLILLGPEGKELARDLRGRRIRDTLRRYLGIPESSTPSSGPLVPWPAPTLTPQSSTLPKNAELLTSSEWTFNPANGHEYCLTSVLSWSDAQAVAERSGGNLATVNDEKENSWLASTFGSCYWIGLNDVAVEGEFVWASGETSTYQNWAPGEPNNGASTGEQDWVIINYAQPGQWDDQYSDSRHHGIVERVRLDHGQK